LEEVWGFSSLFLSSQIPIGCQKANRSRFLVSHLEELLSPSLSFEQKIAIANSLLEKLIEHFDRKAARAKKWFHIYKYASIFLAGATSVITSFELLFEGEFPRWILPVMSAGATVVVAILGTSNTQRLWINSKTTGQRLLSERFLFNQGAGKYRDKPEEERIIILSEQIIQLWNEGHAKWELTVNEG
jgi:hypothetical protein